MAAAGRLADRVEDIIAEAERERGDRQEALKARMSSHERKQGGLGALGEDWIRNVIRPKLAVISEKFPNAMQPSSHGSPHHVSVTLVPTRTMPWQALIGFSLKPLPGSEWVRVIFKVCLMPDPMEYTRQTFQDFPTAGGDLRELNRFLDDSLVSFVRDYLKMHRPELPPHMENYVIDPVCRMVFHRADAATACKWKGRPYYFCVEACRRKFQKEPGLYISGEFATG